MRAIIALFLLCGICVAQQSFTSSTPPTQEYCRIQTGTSTGANNAVFQDFLKVSVSDLGDKRFCTIKVAGYTKTQDGEVYRSGDSMQLSLRDWKLLAEKIAEIDAK